MEAVSLGTLDTHLNFPFVRANLELLFSIIRKSINLGS